MQLAHCLQFCEGSSAPRIFESARQESSALLDKINPQFARRTAKGSPESHSRNIFKILGCLAKSPVGNRKLALNILPLVSTLMDSLNAKAMAVRSAAASVSLLHDL